jgi:hypothetical protein
MVEERGLPRNGAADWLVKYQSRKAKSIYRFASHPPSADISFHVINHRTLYGQ